MTSGLKAKIIERMAIKNLSIAELERRAGLTIHSVRNILKDRIKKPNIHSLQAIAEALDCSLMELLSPTPSNGVYFPQEKSKASPTVTYSSLMIESTKAVLELMAKHKLNVSIDDYLDIVRKVYIYSSKEEPRTVDIRFAEWLVETQLGYSRTG